MDITDLIKMWLIYLLVNQPVFYVVLACIIGFILLFAGAFVKLKNGALSFICYLLMLTATFGLGWLNLSLDSLPWREDLKLKDPETITVSDITNDGIQVRRMWRTVTYPYLGIKLPNDTYGNEAVKQLKSTVIDSSLTVRSSELYSGYVIFDKSDVNWNEKLLSDGLAIAPENYPEYYKSLQNRSMQCKVGRWSESANIQYYKESYEDTFIVLHYIVSLILGGFAWLSLYSLLIPERKSKDEC